MSYPDPIAYTYNADVHCPGCAMERFGTDNQRWPKEDAFDDEGNGLGVIAPWDEWIDPSIEGKQTLACGTCQGVIEEYEDLT